MKVQELAQQLTNIQIHGSADIEIKEIVRFTPDSLKENQLTWANEKFGEQVKQAQAGVIICQEKFIPENITNCVYIASEAPRKTFQEAVSIMYPTDVEAFFSPSATIDSSSKVDESCYIGHNVVIGKNVTVGKHTVIDSNTVIKDNTIIGDHCKIGCNNTIGSAGFGYEKDSSGEWQFINHIGNVVLEDHVEIGNNTTIDRAVLGSTLLRKNSKIDNLVHIAHGVEVGENSMVIANAMVAGSVKIGKDCWISPSSSVLNQKTIEDNAVIGMGAVVLKDVEESAVIIGNPGKPLKR